MSKFYDSELVDVENLYKKKAPKVNNFGFLFSVETLRIKRFIVQNKVKRVQ